MMIETELQPVLEMLNAEAPMHTQPVKTLRRNMRANTPVGTTAGIVIRDFAIQGPGGDLRLRLYWPETAEDLHLAIFVHGGGFVMGDLHTHDGICREVTLKGGCAVLAIDYRLAPEHPFPAGLDDVVATIRWAAGAGAELGVSAEQGIIILGDSAGGNLAAAAALTLRDAGESPLIAQVLIYPVLDYYTPARPSYIENASGYYLTRDDMIAFWDYYLTDPVQADDPRAAPLRAENLGGLPPAFILTAHFDPLRDEGEEYGRRLVEAGSEALVRRYGGVIHGFVRLAAISPTSRRAIEDIGTWIRQIFARGKGPECR